MDKLNTRFAPSPTGFMHIGNLRSALYPYLIAKKTGGKFILRIEDTDQNRFVEGATEVIIDTLKMVNIKYDEGPIIGGIHGPYIQSERKEIYKQYAEKLIKEGKAYYCFCDKKTLDTMRDENGFNGYDRRCRNLTQTEIDNNLKAGLPFVIRQKVPINREIKFFDEVYGEIIVDSSTLQDIVLIKTDGFATYNFAHIIDDYLMEINCVVRGNEYLSSMPSYILLYEALNFKQPMFIHLPHIMGKDADGNISKLSKRHGSVNFFDLVKQGILPEAIINYVAFLGWHPSNSNQEIYSLDELIQEFSISKINKTDAIFDYDKLYWINNQYLSKLSDEKFREYALPKIEEVLDIKTINVEQLLKILKTRINNYMDILEKIKFYKNVAEYDLSIYDNVKNKTDAQFAKGILKDIIQLLEGINDWQEQNLFNKVKEFYEPKGIKYASVMWVIRGALSGLAVSLGSATDIMVILGKEESIKRIKEADNKLQTTNI